MVRILLLDTLPVVCESLAVALTAKGMKAVSCRSFDEAVDLAKRSREAFDLMLLEYSTGGRTPDEVISFAARTQPRCRVLIMTRGLSELEQQRLAGLGASGVFSKQGSFAELVVAITEVAAGRTWFGMQTVRDVASNLLSPQESRASELVLEGLANKEIAARMSVSESCIKALLHKVFLKLNVRTRGQLVRVLMEKSLDSQQTREQPGGRELLAVPGLPLANRTTIFESVPSGL